MVGSLFHCQVDGCQDATTAHVIEGSYTPAGTIGDKPSYKKDGSGTGDDEASFLKCLLF